MTIRSSGSAIGAFLLYFIVEQILGHLAGSIGPAAASIVRFAPIAVFKSLWEPVRYGVIGLVPGQTLRVETSWYITAGVAYFVVFFVAACLLDRRRDV